MTTPLLVAQSQFTGPRLQTPVAKFLLAGARALSAKLVGTTGFQCWALMRDATNDFMRDEKCAFGDPRFDWTEAGGVTLAQECVLEYMEPRT